MSDETAFERNETRRLNARRKKNRVVSDVEPRYLLSQSLLPENVQQPQDWRFPATIEKYVHSLPELYNNSNYLIHYQSYKGRDYPVIKLPKGTMLFSAKKQKDMKPGVPIERELYNFDKKNTWIEDDLHYFYPVPYACRGVNTYADTYVHINICTLTSDTYLMCFLSPASQTHASMQAPHIMTTRLPKIDKDGEVVLDGLGRPDPDYSTNYYNNNVTGSCTGRDYDLCIDPTAMHEMGIQGYIALVEEDAVSSGNEWIAIAKALQENPLHYEIGKEVFDKMVEMSCLTSLNHRHPLDIGRVATNHLNNIRNISPAFTAIRDEAVTRRLFGIPEIVLSPVNTQFFNTQLTREQLINGYAGLSQEERDVMFNYKLIAHHPLNAADPALSLWLSLASDEMLRSLQAPCFYVYDDEIDPTTFLSSYTTDNITTKEQVDYEQAYDYSVKHHPMHDKYVCAFETIAYHSLPSSGTKTGGKEVRKRSRSMSEKTHGMMSPGIKRARRKTVSFKQDARRTKSRSPTKQQKLAKSRAVTRRRNQTLIVKSSRPTCVLELPESNTKVHMQMSKNGVPIMWTTYSGSA